MTKIVQIKELNVDAVINPSTARMDDPSQGGTKMVVIGKPGCFAKGTKVLMMDGSVKCIENIKQGDIVMGDDCTPRIVKDTCFGYEDMYIIIPKFGQPVVVNKKHILSLIKTSGKDKGMKMDIQLEDYLVLPTKTNWSWYRTVVSFPEKDVPIDPYLYGFISGGSLTATKQRYLETLGYSKECYADFLGSDELRPEYCINTSTVRVQVLSGILDSCAVFNKTTKRFVIISQHNEYINQIIFIASSLGYYTSKITNTQSDFVNGYEQALYMCYIYPNVNQVLVTKLIQVTYNNVDFPGYFTTCFYLEKKSCDHYYGITIGNNHRFLLADFSVVHNTGKTTLISSLFYEKKHIFPVGQIHSGTEDSNGFWQTLFPSSFVFNKLSIENIESCIRRQKFAKKHLPNPWTVLLLDDCTDDPKILNTPLFQNIFKNGRHWKMWFILSLQYAGDIKPVIRTNVDVVFILREPNIRNREILYKNYASCIPTFPIFCTIMDKVTEDYTALVVNNAAQSNHWEENVFYYKATPPPSDFKFGCKEFWEYHYTRYDPNKIERI